jgi:glycosyltransferase involved in cell wall biosynthesis
VRIAVDAVGAKLGGAASVLQEILGSVSRSNAITAADVYVSPSETRRFQIERCGNILPVEVHGADTNLLGRMRWLNWGLSAAVRTTGADALLCCNGVGRGPTGVPQFAFVQQSLPFDNEALLRCGLRELPRLLVIREHMARCCSQSRLTFVQTETMKAWVARAFSLPADRIMAFLPGPKGCNSTDAQLYPRAGSGDSDEVSDPKLLYVGSDSPYKNIGVLVKAFRTVRMWRPKALLSVTLPSQHQVCREPGVIGLGYLAEAELAAAYRSATVLVMPSFVETVGLPMLEAMQHGLPVIAADRPYAHDVCADAGLYFDPTDERQLASSIKHVCTDGAVRRELSNRGLRRVAAIGATNAYDDMIRTLVEAVRKGESCAAGGSASPEW